MKRLLTGLLVLCGLPACTQEGPSFLECHLPNIAAHEFLIDVKERRVLNSQELIDPNDGSKMPSFSVAEVNADNLILSREYQWQGKRWKELIYINRYNLRSTDRVWVNDKYMSGGDGTCKVVSKKL